jgi:hypothetical protein
MGPRLPSVQLPKMRPDSSTARSMSLVWRSSSSRLHAMSRCKDPTRPSV